MKKRILSFILVLCLILSALPISVIAQTTVLEEKTLLWQYELIEGGVALTAYNGDATDVYVPASITVNGIQYAVLKLADGIFENNDSLNSVTLGEGVLEIGNRAFYDCDNLVCILLSEKTTTIGSEAFYSCDNFNSIILYDAVTSIGINVFDGCPNLVVWCNAGSVGYNYAIKNNITYKLLNPDAEPETYVQSGVTYYIMNGEAIAIGCDETVINITIPSFINGYPVTKLTNTFNNCEKITKVTLPKTIKTIDNVFNNCKKLKILVIPENITALRNNTISKSTIMCVQYGSYIDIFKTKFPVKKNNYTVNFPLYNDVYEVEIGIEKGSSLDVGAEYKDIAPFVYYGSSITQGGCASRPGNCYQGFISRRFNIDYLNLGFWGSALAEDVIVDYISKLNMSIFISDYDHNAPTIEHLEKTHYKMYETIRKANPNLPYIMVSKPDVYVNDNNDEARREVIKASYEKALKNGDQNVYFIDGFTLFNGLNFTDCTVDSCHPNDLGFFRMSQVIGDKIEEIIKK